MLTHLPRILVDRVPLETSQGLDARLRDGAKARDDRQLAKGCVLANYFRHARGGFVEGLGIIAILPHQPLAQERKLKSDMHGLGFRWDDGSVKLARSQHTLPARAFMLGKEIRRTPHAPVKLLPQAPVQPTCMQEVFQPAAPNPRLPPPLHESKQPFSPAR